MARSVARKEVGNRAAIYARVSDKSQAEEDKTSLSEQATEMEAYCERKRADHHRTLPGGGPGLVQEATRVPADAGRCARGALRHHRVLEVRPPQPWDVPGSRPHGGG